MCFNAEVSLKTFLFSLFTICINYYDDRYILVILYLMSFFSMQLIEFFLWKNINNTYYNKLFSILGFILILLQPLLSIMLIIIKKNKGCGLLYMYIIFLIFVLLNINPNFKTIINKNGHLEWLWLKYPLYIVLIWGFFLIVSRFYMRYIDGIFCLITFIISLFCYWKFGTWGSVWCWVVTINCFFIIYNSIYKNRLLPIFGIDC